MTIKKTVRTKNVAKTTNVERKTTKGQAAEKSVKETKKDKTKPVVSDKKKLKTVEAIELKNDWNLADLKAAEYNPRYISSSRFEKLKKSISKYGDLSGIVFNQRTQRLVSGHQRIKTFDGEKTSIKTEAYTDKHGTVAMGYISARTEHGLVKVPFRVVDWSEETVEKAANIAANNHGGEFDKTKLRKILTSLEADSFDIESLGFDVEDVRKIAPVMHDGTARARAKHVKTVPDSSSLQHSCPRCGKTFLSSGKKLKDI